MKFQKHLLRLSLKMNSCDTVWTRTYNFSANQSDKVESMIVDAAGNVYITGRSDSDPNDTIDNNDIVTIKYNTNGSQQWLQRYNGIGNLRDEPSKIILDNSGHVLVCGRMEKLYVRVQTVSQEFGFHFIVKKSLFWFVSLV